MTWFSLLVVFTLLFVSTGYIKTPERGCTNFADAANNPKYSPVFTDNFNRKDRLEESEGFKESKSAGWWLNSGAVIYFKNGLAETIQGDLPSAAKWHKRYEETNPDESDNGYHPQNIFRLITRNTWQNLQQEAWFRLVSYHKSKSSNRAESNGLLLFNRYLDSDNLYYAGIRVDGTAVIKKKIKGEYYEMADKTIFPGKGYDRNSNPNLLPVKKWIGLRTTVSNEANKTVRIKLFMNYGGSNKWRQIVEAVDNGKSYGGTAILSAGHAGIRTDFMDVQLDNYKIAGIGMRR
jgi:hypothetical protein